VIVAFGKNRLQVPFLIDTGADLTVLQPDHVRRLLSEMGQELSRSNQPDHLSISRIGSHAEPTTVGRVGLHFTDDLRDG
jgi:predicted aspartyl protease